jgi:hypothetical protein
VPPTPRGIARCRRGARRAIARATSADAGRYRRQVSLVAGAGARAAAGARRLMSSAVPVAFGGEGSPAAKWLGGPGARAKAAVGRGS